MPPEARRKGGGEPLRVLHCLWSGAIGGAEGAVYGLVREQLRDPRIEPSLLFARGEGEHWESAHELPVVVLSVGLPHSRSLRQLPSIASRMRPFDVHHFHAAEPLLMLASLLCPGARRVYTHRGGTTDYGVRKRLRHAVSGLVLRRAFHGFSGNTGHAADCAARLFGIPRSRFQVTYNGIDPGRVRPARTPEAVRRELGLREDDYVLGTAANLKPWKRVERLLAALSAIGDPRLRLVVLGDGVDRPRLESIAAELALGERVVFAGLRADVPDYLQVMDAFSLPSTGLESFGNAAVEAMCAGLPTIVFADSDGLAEHIRPGETGFVVGDGAELVETLRRLMADRVWGREIGKRARAHVIDRYPPEASARAYASLYAAATNGATP